MVENVSERVTEFVTSLITCSRSLTRVAGVPSPAWRTRAAESVTVVVTGASVTAGGGVTLVLTWLSQTNVHSYTVKLNFYQIEPRQRKTRAAC